YYPFLHASRFGRGVSLALDIVSPTYDCADRSEVPYLEATATLDDGAGTMTIFAVNRHQTDELTIDADIRAFAGWSIVGHNVLEHPNGQAANTAERPDTVVPHDQGNASIEDTLLHATLPPMSWNVIRLQKMEQPVR
ncbi:MAG: alpha-L-arabinofuranosidase C-terminal domain-containing protein, partial [Thermomicrobiales bacterium]